MNVGQLIRSLVGELQPADAKTLELKVGQIVKGLVLQLLSEQDALVNIGGVLVRAKLETPLKQGEVTLLQVQPESANGQIILKPLQSSDVRIAEQSLPELLKDFGLKDQPATREALQTLHREGIPIAKETAEPFVRMVQQAPAGVPDQEWEQTLLLAMKKDLPLTQEGMTSLHRAVYGAPMNENLNRLSAQIRTALQSGTAVPAETQKLLGQIQALVDEIHTIGSQIAQADTVAKGTTDGRHPLAAGTAQTDSPESGGNPGNANKAAAEPQAAVKPDPGAAARPTTPTVAPSTQNGVQAGASVEPDTSVKTPPPTGIVRTAAEEAITGSGTAPDKLKSQTAGAAPITAAEETITGSGTAPDKVKSQSAGAALITAAVPQESKDQGVKLPELSTNAEPTDREQSQQPLARLFKLLGVDHEQKMAKLLDAVSPSADGLQPNPLKPEDQAIGRHQAAETLKSLLMQAAGSEQLPAALKEQVQQVIQQITGQQLLMSPDRGALFSHVTLMIPIHHPDGGQTASIHIQSRKGKRGELDANNCRLLFDLDMKTLGDMLVDVQVYNRIVSLNIHNDHPLMEPLLESQRNEIAAGMETVGYQLSSLKTSPFPEKKAAEDSAASSVKTFYETKPYKSMDIRI